MARRGGLGRGLGSLIPTGPTPAIPVQDNGSTAVDDAQQSPVDTAAAALKPTAASMDAASMDADSVDAGSLDRTARDTGPVGGFAPVHGAYFAEIPIAEIRPNPKQPRQAFDEEALEELTSSIREFGVLQPIVVRPLVAADVADDGIRYELVMGERRLRAAIEVGLTGISAIVRETDDAAMLRDALLENLHRAQLNPLEEAAAYQQLLEEFGATHEELATRIGRSRSQVSNTIRLLNLPVVVQRRVAAGVLSAGHARALLALPEHQTQDALAARIVAEGLSVRATEELVALAATQGPARAVRRPARKFTAPAIAALSDKLSDAFDTRVRVEIGKRKGKITVEFGSIDDLERLVALMAPQLATKSTDPAAD